jgi:hypothetical protein
MMLASRARRALRNVCAKNEFREPIQLGEFVQMPREKYLDSVFQKYVVCSRRSALPRGAYRDRHERLGGMRWTRAARLTRAVRADGEAVWSWRPDAGANYGLPGRPPGSPLPHLRVHWAPGIPRALSISGRMNFANLGRNASRARSRFGCLKSEPVLSASSRPACAMTHDGAASPNLILRNVRRRYPSPGSSE